MKPESNSTTTYTSLETIKIDAPTIKICPKAIKWLTALAEIHDHEVGCFGFVDQLENNTYFIRDIFYPKHSEANGGTCEISPEGETCVAEWLMSKGRENDINKMRFWAHSHVNMGVSQSGQDESQSIDRMNKTESYFIRGIFNKAGLLSISFFDYQNKRRFDNIKWITEDDVEDKLIREKIQELKKINLPNRTVQPIVQFNNTYEKYENNSYPGWSQGWDCVPNQKIAKPGLIMNTRKHIGIFDKTCVEKSKKNKQPKDSYSYEFEELGVD